MNFEVWHSYTLAQIALDGKDGLVDGPFGSNLPERLYTASGIPVIRGSNLSKGKERFKDTEFVYVSEATAAKLSRSQCLPNDIVFTKKGTLGQLGFIPSDKHILYLLSSNQMRMRVNRSVASPEFVYYYLSQPASIEKIIRDSEHTGVPKINLAYLREFPILLPSLQYQVEIASVLRSLDDRIALLRETNTTLEAIAQALFKSWFVDFDPVHAKQQGGEPVGMDMETAALFPDSFEESELGLVPSGWKIGSVGEEIQTVDFVANGSFASLKQNVTLLDKPGYAIYLRTTDYNSGFNGGFRYVEKKAYDFLSKSSLDGSEVIISNVGDIGTVFRAPKWLGMPMTLGSNAVALKNKKLSGYMYCYFKSDKGQHAIQSIVTGSAQLKFNKTNLRSLKILIPSNHVLVRFEEVTRTLLEKMDSNYAQAKILSDIRDTLLPRLISGQLRLEEVETIVEEIH